MSIVEKALQKLQLSAQRASGPPQPRHVVVGTVVPNHAPKESAPSPEPPRPSKIVHVDRDALRRSGLMPPESDERELSHQYRTVKRPLIRAALEPAPAGAPPRRLIMLASALPGEGKTFTSINLALSLSLETDHTVLLVDADCPKPHVSRVFGVDQEPGLLDALADTSRPVEAALASAIVGTDIPRLSLLPAGRRTELASELLASGRMKELMRRLPSVFPNAIVLFDSSPILLTSEARILAHHVGQVVLVVAAGQTPQQALKDALGHLEGVEKVSLILNQAVLSGPLAYYYGYGYGHEEQKPARARSDG